MSPMAVARCMVVVVIGMVASVAGLECGKQTIRNGRIVGGEDAFDGEFPFLVSLRLGGSVFGQHHCGGVVLKKLWVLTAGHCVTRFNHLKFQCDELHLSAMELRNPMFCFYHGRYSKNSFTVRVGEFDLTKPETNHTEKDYPLEKIILHPELYRPKRYNNDIALLKLQKPVEYDSYSWPICLPELDEDFTGQMGTVVGWGFKEENGGRRSSILQKVQLPVMNRTQCQELFNEAQKRMKFEHGQICAGYREGKKDSCQGDSGGPLVIKKDGHYTVIGVVSAGIGCARPLLPGVYTHVPNHMKWIRETIESN